MLKERLRKVKEIPNYIQIQNRENKIEWTRTGYRTKRMETSSFNKIKERKNTWDLHFYVLRTTCN